MKRILSLILLCILILSGCSVSPSNPINFDGAWYSADNGYLYQFTNGTIFCEESYYTLDDGQQITGAYDVRDGYIDVFIIGLGGFKETKPLYMIEHNGCKALCDSADGTGRIYFYNDSSVALQISIEEQAKLDEWLEDNSQQETTQSTEVSFDPKSAVTVSYDSIVAGEHTSKIVGIEAILSNYEYNELLGMYSFDLWYWSDKENKYIRDEGCFIFVDDYTPETIEPLSTYDDGDKIKIVIEVYRDNSFGPSAYIWSELLEKNEISNWGIEIPDETEIVEESTNNSADADRYVYITDSGSKYHTANCRWVSDSCIRITYEEAKSKGYTPCGTCNPSP